VPRHLLPAYHSALQSCVQPTIHPFSVAASPLFLQLSTGVGTSPCKTQDKGQQWEAAISELPPGSSAVQMVPPPPSAACLDLTPGVPRWRDCVWDRERN